jgi:hypothetical protein
VSGKGADKSLPQYGQSNQSLAICLPQYGQFFSAFEVSAVGDEFMWFSSLSNAGIPSIHASEVDFKHTK